MNILHKYKFIYKLSSEEIKIFNNLLCNVLIQILSDKNRDYLILNKNENDLLDKIHAHFYGKDWWIADPISTMQVNYILFNDIRNKLIF